MASGMKIILLSPMSPRVRSLKKSIALFPSPQRLKNCDKTRPTSLSCSTPRGLGSVDRNVVEERLSASVHKPSKEKAFDSSQSASSSVVSGCIQIDTPVVPCTPSCATPVKASSVDVTNTREHETIFSNRKPPVDNKQKPK